MENNSKDNYHKVREILTQLEEFKSAPTSDNWLSEAYSPTDLAKIKYGQELVTELGDFERIAYKDNDFEENCSIYAIYHFKDHGIYIKFEGDYNSYEGTRCGRIFQVAPQVVTETQYLAVE